MGTLHITVGERDDLRADTLQFVRDAESSRDLDDRAVIQFGTYDDLVDNLTPRRLELVRAIAREAPESMREAARLGDRDVSDVHGDLKRLEVLGIIELEEAGSGGALRPIVPYDGIEMHVEYPLFETDGADGTATNAD